MKDFIHQIVKDERGFIISSELVIIGTILVLGLVVGMTSLQTAVVEELTDRGSCRQFAEPVVPCFRLPKYRFWRMPNQSVEGRFWLHGRRCVELRNGCLRARGRYAREAVGRSWDAADVPGTDIAFSSLLSGTRCGLST